MSNTRRRQAIDAATVALIDDGADHHNPDTVYQAGMRMFWDRARLEVRCNHDVTILEAINSRPALNSARDMATVMIDILLAIEPMYEDNAPTKCSHGRVVNDVCPFCPHGVAR